MKETYNKNENVLEVVKELPQPEPVVEQYTVNQLEEIITSIEQTKSDYLAKVDAELEYFNSLLKRAEDLGIKKEIVADAITIDK